MKNLIRLKLLILFSCTIFSLTNCSEPKYKDINIQSQYGIINNAEFNYINEFTYKNHDYIMFVTDGTTSRVAGIVHNPECKTCYERKEISSNIKMVKQTSKK